MMNALYFSSSGFSNQHMKIWEIVTAEGVPVAIAQICLKICSSSVQ